MNMAGTSKATVAGILDITAGAFALVGAVPLLAFGLGGAVLLGVVPDADANRVAFLPAVIFLPLALLALVTGIVAVAGGIAALNRRRWGLAVVGAVAAVLAFFPVGVAAVVFTILAESEIRTTGETDITAE
jgi:hypothetical protein